MKEELKTKILASKVISFDVFDTLITRIVDRPEAVFELMEQHFALPGFAKLRKQMQAEVGLLLQQEKKIPHANLTEIYQYMKEHSNIQNTNELMTYELQLEKELLYQNKPMYEVYQFAKKHNKRVVVTSDMYIEMKDFKAILAGCGYKDLDAIYLSSKELKAKFDGTLYDVLLERENVAASEILHIGDNEKDDYHLAKEKGISVYHYQETLLPSKSDNLVLSFHYGISRLLKLEESDFWTNLGFTAGLLYVGLFKRLEALKKDKIHFLARDGYNLYHLFKEFAPAIKTEYVYTSRRALLLGGITKLDEASLALLPPFTFGQTVGEILDYIAMREVFCKEDLLAVGFTSFSDVITSLDDFDKMKQLYCIKEKDVLAVCKKEREAARLYFQKLGMIHRENFCFDCGWNGSSQYLLERLFKALGSESNVSFYYTGIFDNAKSRKQLENSSYDAYLFQLDRGSDYVERLHDSVAILELFFGAPHNSVLKYQKGSYCLDTLEKETDYKENILKGLRLYFEKALPVFSKYDLSISAADALAPLFRLIEHPTEEEAITIGNLENIDGFAQQKGITKHIAYVTMEQLLENENIEIYWKQGLLARPDVTEEVKAFVKKKYALEEVPTIPEMKNVSYFGRLKRALATHGYRTTWHLVKQKLKHKIKPVDPYQEWIKKNERDIYETTELSYQPLISFVVPVYNAISNQLEACIESVRDQTYQNWQLILVDDCSTLEETKEVLKAYTGIDDRIVISYHTKNGHISKTTNDGIALSKGEFIALLDNDDVVAPNALFEMVKKLNEEPDLDFIYSDEDKLTEDGSLRHDPFFKPDWSPDTFMSLMYTCHFAIFRKTIVDAIGGFTVGLDGAQDYDFVLRFTEKTNRVGHIPKMLYHWRERVGSIANDPKAKPYALEAIVKLKEQALKRRGQQGKIVYEPSVFQYRVVYEAKKKSVHLLLHSLDPQKAIQKMEAIKALKDESLSSISIVTTKKMQKAFQTKGLEKVLILLEEDLLASSKAWKKITEKLILFVDDSVTLTKDSIALLAGHAALDHVAMVGPKILWENTTTIASCGLTPQLPYQVLREQNDTIAHYYCRNKLDYNVFALDPHCFSIKKDCLLNVLPLEKDFALALGKAIRKAQLFNVIRNDAIVYQERHLHAEESVILAQFDPFVSPHVEATTFAIKTPFLKKMTATEIDAKELVETKHALTYRLALEKKEDMLQINGYAFSTRCQHNNANKISLILKSKDQSYQIKTKKYYDIGVSNFYQQNYNFTNFQANIARTSIIKGTYEVYITLENKLDKQIMIQNTNKKIEL